jgi:hypothetical protein
MQNFIRDKESTLKIVVGAHRAWIVSLILFLCAGLVAWHAGAQPVRRQLSGHVPGVVARLQPLHRLAATNQIRLDIGLPVRQPAALKTLLDQIYDPASPNYHHYLSTAEFTARFGPTEEDYQTVINFAKAHGLSILTAHSNRLVLEVRGSVADIERAFQVKMQAYQHPTEAREFFAPDVEPSVEAGIPILDLGGLNNYVLPRPRLRLKPEGGNGGQGVTRIGSGPRNLGYMGSDFRAAYAPGIANTGTGQSVGLVEFDNYYAKDIYTYETNAHLSTNIVLDNVFLGGFGGTPGSGNEEVALDIELAISMAPGLSSVLIYAESYPGDATSANTLFSRIFTDNLAKQISCSWIVPVDATTDNLLQECAVQGQSFFNASGDDGGYIGSIPPPSDDPYMTQVGGTELTTTGPGGSWVSEVVWELGDDGGSSGGVSPMYPIPGWQQLVNVSGTMGSAYQRNFPDVAMVAQSAFTVSNNGRLRSASGTSCGGPLWAGFAALVNQQAAATGKGPIGLINSAVYRIASQTTYAASFHDITVGNNTNINCVSEFFAEPGYDLCTGVGSPIGNSLFNALLAPADPLQILPLATLYMSGPVGGPFNLNSLTFSLTNMSASPLAWTTGITAGWLSISPGGGTLAANGAVTNITVSLNGTANTLAAGVYNATVWFSNEVSQIGQGRQFSLSVGQPVVANGGFENGDISYWILDGDTGTNDFVDNGSTTGISPHSGNYFAVMGTLAPPLATLSQTVATFPGQPYLLSFWMLNPDLGYGNTPNEFNVSWNGATLFDQTDIPTISSWTNLQFSVLSTGISGTVQFAAYNFNSFFGLDDVSATPIPLPKFLSAGQNNGIFTSTWSAVPGQTYQVQYSTNLAGTNWMNLGSPFVASSSTIVTTNQATPVSWQFYRIALVLQ